jgi:hypothetical protein
VARIKRSILNLSLMTKRFRLGIIILILIIFSTTLLSQPAMVLTNEEIIWKQVGFPTLQAIDSLSGDTTGVQIRLEKQSELGIWLDKKLQEQIIKNQVILYDTLADVSGNLLILNIGPVASEIFYRSKKRNLFLRTTKFERIINTYLSFSLRDKNGKILIARSLVPEYRDTIKNSSLKTVESNYYQFTRGEKIESKFINYFVEPLLVTVTTVGVVYLFFSLRSGS